MEDVRWMMGESRLANQKKDSSTPLSMTSLFFTQLNEIEQW
jgi:hypothetical protein